MAPFRILLTPCPIIRPCKRSSSYVTSRTRKTRFSLVQWACSRASASSGVKVQGNAAPAIQTWQRVSSRPARQRVRHPDPVHEGLMEVGLMAIEHLIRYAPRAVGLKPSAIRGEARLRGLYRIIYSKTTLPRRRDNSVPPSLRACVPPGVNSYPPLTSRSAQ